MLITIASYAVTAVLPFTAYLGYLRYVNRKIPKVLTKKNINDENWPNAGMTVIDYEIPPETEEEYLTRLKTIHPAAWKEYQSDYRNKKIIDNADRYIGMLILQYRNGEIDMVCGTHTMDFADGTELWVGNKYYSYGNIYKSNRQGLVFEKEDGRLSPYTFMSIVDLEHEKTNFTEWKKWHDEYSRNRLKGITALLSK